MFKLMYVESAKFITGTKDNITHSLTYPLFVFNKAPCLLPVRYTQSVT
jgi:hypothetical protein